MKFKAKIFVTLSVLFLSLVGFSSLALAQGSVTPSGRTDNPSTGTSAKCVEPKAGDEFCPAEKFCYINGLCMPRPDSNVGGLRGASTVFEVVAIVLKWLLTFAGMIAVVFIIIGGYQYVTSAGNEELAEKGKKTLINAIMGVVVVALSMAIVTIVTNTLGSSQPLGYKSNQVLKG